MRDTFSVKQLSKTKNLDGNSITHHYEMNVTSRSMVTKPNNPKITQNQTPQPLG